MVKCEKCGKGFEKNRHLRLHFARNHVDKALWKSKCSKCNKVYADEEILQRHMKNHERNKTKVSCPVDSCDKSFFRQSFLNKHIIASHPECIPQHVSTETCEEINNNRESKRKQYKCTEAGCDSSFGKHHLLTQHSFVHTNIPPFQCGQCEKRFMTLNHKNRHEKVHNGYPCTSCDAVMTTWTSLLTHVARQHKKEYKCKNCDKIFFTPSRLKAHEVLHREERQVYQCSECERNFTKKHAMNKHMKIFHNGIKQHTCPVEGCDKTYAHKRTLKNHISKIHCAPATTSNVQKKKRSDKLSAASRILGFDMKTFEAAMDIS